MSFLPKNALSKIPNFLLRKMTPERLDELVDAAVASQARKGASMSADQIAEARAEMRRMLQEAQGVKA